MIKFDSIFYDKYINCENYIRDICKLNVEYTSIECRKIIVLYHCCLVSDDLTSLNLNEIFSLLETNDSDINDYLFIMKDVLKNMAVIDLSGTEISDQNLKNAHKIMFELFTNIQNMVTSNRMIEYYAQVLEYKNILDEIKINVSKLKQDEDNLFKQINQIQSNIFGQEDISGLNEKYSDFFNDTENSKNTSLFMKIIEQYKILKSNKNMLENLTNQMIGIVSMFVGVAFVMFGGMTLLNNLFDFSEMQYVPVIELLCLGSLIGIVMIAVIYAFMTFVIRIIGKELKQKFELNKVVKCVLSILIIICFLSFGFWIYVGGLNHYTQSQYNQQIVEEKNMQDKNSIQNQNKTDYDENTRNF